MKHDQIKTATSNHKCGELICQNYARTCLRKVQALALSASQMTCFLGSLSRLLVQGDVHHVLRKHLKGVRFGDVPSKCPRTITQTRPRTAVSGFKCSKCGFTSHRTGLVAACVRVYVCMCVCTYVYVCIYVCMCACKFFLICYFHVCMHDVHDMHYVFFVCLMYYAVFFGISRAEAILECIAGI